MGYFNIYGYFPSLPGASVLLVLFILSILALGTQLYLSIRKCVKKSTVIGFYTSMLVGSLMESLGYGFRIAGHFNPNVAEDSGLDFYIIQQVMTVVAPIFYTAAIYVISSRLIATFGRTYSVIPPNFLPYIFIVADVACLSIQSAGAAIAASAQSTNKDPGTGEHINTAGLALQLVCFGFFLILLSNFAARWYKGRREGINNDAVLSTKDVKFALAALFSSSLLILLRTTFRTVEMAMGVEGWLAQHEIPFYLLDALPVIVAVIILIIFAPYRLFMGRVIPEAEIVARLQTPRKAGESTPETA